MKVRLRCGRPSDLVAYTAMLQRTYAATYPHPKIGLTKKCFSKAVFATENTQAYLYSNLKKRNGLKTWLAFSGEKLVGSITREKKGNEYEIRGFYVPPEDQRKGIGKLLWQEATSSIGDNPIILDLYAHNTDIMLIYKRWGFVRDFSKGKKGITWSHWPEWPEGVRAKRVHMRLQQSRRV